MAYCLMAPSHYLNQSWLKARRCVLHPWAISQDVALNLIHHMCLEITLLKLLAYLPEGPMHNTTTINRTTQITHSTWKRHSRPSHFTENSLITCGSPTNDQHYQILPRNVYCNNLEETRHIIDRPSWVALFAAIPNRVPHPHRVPSFGLGHEGVAVLLPGFAFNWQQNSHTTMTQPIWKIQNINWHTIQKKGATPYHYSINGSLYMIYTWFKDTHWSINSI